MSTAKFIPRSMALCGHEKSPSLKNALSKEHTGLKMIAHYILSVNTNSDTYTKKGSK